MILIYGKGKVGTALKEFLDYNKIESQIKDDSDNISDFSPYDKIIPSPGVPPTNKIYKTGKIVGELDFIYSFLPKGFQIISVTGTDGKSTTAWIIYNILKQEFGDNKVFLSGNFDESFAKTVLDIQKSGLKSGYIVLEVSSFMAYNIDKFVSDYSIFTNFEKDHLNWHKDFKDYLNSKLKLFKNTKKKSIINSQILKKAKELSVNLDLENTRIFGIENDLENRVEASDIIVSGKKKCSIDETNFSGLYNALNILSSVIVLGELKVCSKRIREYLKNVSPLSHRLEFYKEINGIKFIDDSKSTSAQSLKAALESVGGNILLIAGGSDKGDDFEYLAPLLKEKVKHGELIGETSSKLGLLFNKNSISFHYAISMNDAVKKAYKFAESGDTILLSPGCASFGLFRDYLDRADKFREAVDEIEAR
ncbi:UDP-N-acetylmuramoyl-L-alanine--D-glutamate ligase [Candidatus Gracilibacteria bacterium]|nr:UDP-N-acetylmuramoyl-L-alanine--D-glutamate ligase [Candidatus Gracilibacteria bacterium]